MPKHFIAMSGSFSCLPDFCDVYPTQEAAVEALAQVHELSGHQKKVLRQERILNLSVGADYAQISPCECGNPKLHSDDEHGWWDEETE